VMPSFPILLVYGRSGGLCNHQTFIVTMLP